MKHATLAIVAALVIAAREGVTAITGGTDLAAAQSQKATMTLARRSLADATARAVNANAGFRAVSAMPALDNGRPVAEVTLVRGDEWKVVTEALD